MGGEVDQDGPALWFAGLDAAIEHALRPWTAGHGSLGLLYSGGVDSSVLAHELSRRDGLRLCTVGVRGSPDLVAAESGARRLGLPWRGVAVGEEEVRSTLAELAEELAPLHGVGRTVLVSLAVAVRSAGVSPLLCGQGADELFLGYAHYRGLTVVEAQERSDADLTRLRDEEWPRSRAIARRLGVDLAAPFLDPAFVTAAQRVPIPERLPRPVAKALFRAWATHRGLPVDLAARPKRALQYGSGIHRLLERMERTTNRG